MDTNTQGAGRLSLPALLAATALYLFAVAALLGCKSGAKGGIDFATTVPGSGDRCAKAPPDYQPFAPTGSCQAAGELCFFANDCCSGHCIPTEQDVAVCTRSAAFSDSCKDLGDDWNASARELCVQGQWDSLCMPDTNAASDQSICGCSRNEECDFCPVLKGPQLPAELLLLAAGQRARSLRGDRRHQLLSSGHGAVVSSAARDH